MGLADVKRWIQALMSRHQGRRNLVAPPQLEWDAGRITDEWFRAHFEGAAPIVLDWLERHQKLGGARIMDFGCGDGITALAVALKARPQRVLGVDITGSFGTLQALALDQIGLASLPDNLSFAQIKPNQSLSSFGAWDVLISWSTFEHIDRIHLPSILRDLCSVVKADGVFFLQIEPLFYSPFGSHLGRFIKEPWAHLLYDEKTLYDRVMRYEDDIPLDEKEYNFYARSYDEYKEFVFGEYLKLNKLTADELCALLTEHGFDILRRETYRRHEPVPQALTVRYSDDVLTTSEIRLLMKRR